MKVEWIYCPHCGYEDFSVFVAYSRTVANGMFPFALRVMKKQCPLNEEKYDNL